jgi:hypothetical protein
VEDLQQVAEGCRVAWRDIAQERQCAKRPAFVFDIAREL